MISEQLKIEVREALKAACENMSQNDLAKAIASKEGNFSSATLSQIMNGKDELVRDTMYMKCINFLGLNSKEWTSVETVNRHAIFKLCDDAKDYKQMMAVAATTGYGKTSSLEQYAAKHRKEVFYIHFVPEMKTHECLEHIASSIGLQVKGSNAYMIVKIAQKLKTKELTILDNTDKVINQIFAVLQGIYDASEGKIGIVLSGTQFLKQLIERKAARNARSFPELYSRIAYWQPLYAPTPEAIRGICMANGVADEKAQNYIIEKGNNFRTVRHYITAAKRTGKAIDRPLLASLHIGSSNWMNG